MTRKLKECKSSDILAWSKAIHAKLGEIQEWYRSKYPCVFLSLPGEVDTRAFINMWSHEKEFSVPKWAGDTFIPVRFKGWDAIVKNRWNVDEPSEADRVLLPIIDCVLVPGLAFSKEGKRLGRGMGFYDRFLSKIRAPKIGIAFELQIEKNIPMTEFDQKVDMVVTEKNVYRV